jgi:hypothetical protein
MALKVTKAQVWAGDIQDQPGGLAEVLGQLSTAGASVEFIIARREDRQSGKGKVFLTPLKGKKAMDAAKAAGLNVATNIGTLRVEGPDKPGMGWKIMDKIAAAGVNVRGVSAAVIGNKFVAYIGLDSQADADRAAKSLKGM